MYVEPLQNLKPCFKTMNNHLKDMNIKYYYKIRASKYVDKLSEEILTDTCCSYRILLNNDLK